MSKLILCTDENNGIGYQNTIPWHSKEDFQHFKETTTGKIVIMGYNTWKSLPHKPLPGRMNIILLSRDYNAREAVDADSSVLFLPEESMYQLLANNPDAIVIGGTRIYTKALPFVDEVIRSEVQGTYECDTFFDIHSNPDIHLELSSAKTLGDGTIVEYWKRV